MRIILYTGKGGVGKTSVAAATAVKTANLGAGRWSSAPIPRTAGDSLDRKLSSEPLAIRENLVAQEIDTLHEVEEGWGGHPEISERPFRRQSVKTLQRRADHVSGMEDLLSLLRILKYYKEGDTTSLSSDCAPTGRRWRCSASRNSSNGGWKSSTPSRGKPSGYSGAVVDRS